MSKFFFGILPRDRVPRFLRKTPALLNGKLRDFLDCSGDLRNGRRDREAALFHVNMVFSRQNRNEAVPHTVEHCARLTFRAGRVNDKAALPGDLSELVTLQVEMADQMNIRCLFQLLPVKRVKIGTNDLADGEMCHLPQFRLGKCFQQQVQAFVDVAVTCQEQKIGAASLMVFIRKQAALTGISCIVQSVNNRELAIRLPRDLISETNNSIRDFVSAFLAVNNLAIIGQPLPAPLFQCSETLFFGAVVFLPVRSCRKINLHAVLTAVSY